MASYTRRAVWTGLLAATAVPVPALSDDEAGARFKAIEAGTGGRLGVSVAGEGFTPLLWRADERFAFCSTFKVLAAAAVLARIDAGAVRLDQALPLREADLLSYAPVCRKAFTEGRGSLTVAEACEAAIVWSDNTAANLQFALLGGPEALTRWVRGIGDTVTRFDRTEMDLNTAIPGDPRDTTFPTAMRETLRRVLLGTVLTPESRGRLEAWMVGGQTGFKRLRAGLPAAWTVGDKTGTGGGDTGTYNDVAIIRPPDRAPLIATVFLTRATATPEVCDAAHAEIGRLIAARIPR
ncbi:class A beta-lactamase [Methylobacterium aerolatum]|uniref:Beta-lactamase n=1 Tax=Methylobacterium aerolatum TaxID=418708 RepID=A0ABU0I4K9_9HYPH|nr:class A beta-lactamase [Methylobacterium aerolatum]MDQ0449535.1 beta-lactamase class A [Methylobacterium aerolatum]GJD33565.1 Beta-lactamase CTX-M-97 [Methylobacterium aerolatum]